MHERPLRTAGQPDGQQIKREGLGRAGGGEQDVGLGIVGGQQVGHRRAEQVINLGEMRAEFVEQ
ncbi:hypothetical protein C1280_20570 [Gemmata obscuriglobus]|uniref:Uncharacterized protein n=1 Tax=Gemmata obscuriglobus TaxID=114 RepID=A0A2Z3H487_9BACT|nr:hypothetical protein C1280_20570 [Gemmata obscuriglobus]